MAKAPQSFKINADNKTIIIYTNVEPNTAEQKLQDFYLKSGYTPLMEEKKKGIRVADMRKALEGTDKLDEFNELYANGDFFGACKIYTEFKKSQN